MLSASLVKINLWLSCEKFILVAVENKVNFGQMRDQWDLSVKRSTGISSPCNGLKHWVVEFVTDGLIYLILRGMADTKTWSKSCWIFGLANGCVSTNRGPPSSGLWDIGSDFFWSVILTPHWSMVYIRSISLTRWEVRLTTEETPETYPGKLWTSLTITTCSSSSWLNPGYFLKPWWTKTILTRKNQS